MITILAIESSCDDTSAAVIRDGILLSNVIAGQKVHEEYGGVVPELASRAHQQNILVLAEGVETLQELGCLLDLQVDLLQGFLLARPTEIPGEINPEAVKRIQSFSCQAVF